MSINAINRRAKIEGMPRLRFVCGTDWSYGPKHYEVGFMWRRNLDAEEGEFAYKRWLLVRFSFEAWIDRRFS